MSYILDVMNGNIEPRGDRITLEEYVVEDSYITKYLSKVVKDKALSIYHVLFHLTYFETGKGEIIIPWAKVGSYIRSEQGNIIDDQRTVTRRIGDLLNQKCITVNRQRGGANEIIVHLPSQIPACIELIQNDAALSLERPEKDNADYYSDPERRLMILERDHRKCVYCLVEVSEESYHLDHIIPVSKGGTNIKFNLVTSCEACNQRKQDEEVINFLQSNYRNQLIDQSEYLKQKEYIEKLVEQQT